LLELSLSPSKPGLEPGFAILAPVIYSLRLWVLQEAPENSHSDKDEIF